ncbi:MAG TPA: DUF192 domain-containing protein [Deltaproteobacteria bacterium]|nr:DUF192 domain-containing protein [Deltaproteobacteria bacterium]
MKRSFWFLWLALLVSACGSQNLTPVKIYGPEGRLKAEFEVELALTPAQRSQGLMFRKELGSERGMLFVFPENTQSPFWMKNTLIELDMVFIDADKKIVSIVHRAAPQTTTPRSSESPYRYCLEVEGGRVEELGLEIGDTVEFNSTAF